MRGWMQGKTGLIVVAAASTVLLGSCLVSKKDPKSYTSDSPTLPTYLNNHFISMQYESYLVGASPQSPGRNISLKWQESILPLPFGLGSRRALRFVFEYSNGSAVQYITQDSNGSIFLHAFEGVGSVVPGSQTRTFWPNKGASLNAPNQPTPLQVFWSPLTDGADTDRAANGTLDFNILGECDNSTPCLPIGTMKAGNESSVGYFVDRDKLSVPTPLGNFLAYHIRYSGTLAATDIESKFTPSAGFDYRASCLPPGKNGIATFEGEIWVYPPIGPVKIRNFCVPSGGGATTSYVANITGTNIPFD